MRRQILQWCGALMGLSIATSLSFLIAPTLRIVFASPVAMASVDGCTGVYGAIGAVYYANGGPLGPLGPSNFSCEQEFGKGDGSDPQAARDAQVDKYQKFQNGTIVYNHQEKTAFALFTDLYDKYLLNGGKGKYGLPITSQIGSGLGCRGYFQNGYIFCSGESGLWSDIPAGELRQRMLTIPNMRLPYSGTMAVFNGGPHSYEIGGLFNGKQQIGDGSGLDFSAANLDVLAMASGTVIGVDGSPCGGGFGNWVAIRNDFSGTVLIYGHLTEIDTKRFKPGVWVRRGTIIGNTGETLCGNGTGPHVHIELRDGTSRCDSTAGNCVFGFGSPIDWNGIVLDGHVVSAFQAKANPSESYAYDGVAISTIQDPTKKYAVLSGFWPDTGYRVDDIRFRDRVYVPETQKWVFSSVLTEGKSFLTDSFANWCDGQGASRSCVDNSIEPGKVIFDLSGPWASSDDPATLSSGAASSDGQLAMLLDAPRLQSSNVPRTFEERYTPAYPDDPPVVPPNGDTCPTDNRPGVYFYAQPNYQPACVFSTVDVPAFSATSVGDNNLRSVRIVGDYQVKLYREVSFGGGAYEELNSSEADITWRSMGTDVSSARVINKAVQSNCPTDNRNGVYLYADRDLAGACYFATTDVADLGTTVVGDNNVSSAKIVGYYTVKLYENTSFGGRSDELNGNGYKEELNLDIRSLGGAYSSLRISAQAGADLVSNIRVASGRSYQWNKCKVGAPYYTDRSYVIDSVSQDDYSNLWCIRTANDDKDRSDKELLSFELNRNATIYVYFDRRMTAAPSWVGTLYNQNSKRIYTSDNDMDYFVVYSCKSTPGVITLGGPHYSGGTGAKSMYVVAFREENSASQFCNGTFPVPPTPTYTPAPAPTATEVFPTPVPPPTILPEISDAHLFAEQGAITAGQPARFTIVVYNAGSLDSVALATQLPPGLRYVDGSASNGATYDLAAHQIRWAGTIFNSQTLVIQFEALLTDTSLPAVTVNLTVAGQGAGVVAESAVIQVVPPSTSTPTATPGSGGQPPGPDTTPVPAADRLFLPAVTK